MRWLLLVAFTLTPMGLGGAWAAGLNVPTVSTGATGSGDVVAGVAVVTTEFVPDPDNTSLLDNVELTLDKTPPGGGPLLHLNVFVQLKNSGGTILGSPKRINDFGGGLNGAAKTVAVNFFGDGIALADIAAIEVTVCDWHSGNSDFECRSGP